jgi:hypothetical protein
MKKSQSSLKDYMYSRAKVGAPKSNLGGGEPDTKYSDSEIKSKKPQVQSMKMEAPSSFKGDLRNESKEYKKYVADTDKKGKRKAAVRNLKKFGKIVGGGAATLVGGYYGLTRKPTEKETRTEGGNYFRRWRWDKEK